jgi:SAM-dependent methyltransferase
VSENESLFGRTYRCIYEGVCGRHPRVHPWHFQWLDTFYLYNGLYKILPKLSGVILDAGCGIKPYRNWFKQVDEYIGLDVVLGEDVDVVISSEQPWPFTDEYFDVILSSQVLEHVEYLEFTLSEMSRVLKRGGQIVLSCPFIYNEHGAPWDFQRFTANRAKMFFPGFQIVSLERQGGIGSTLAILLLNWVEQFLNGTYLTRIFKALMLPMWILVSLAINMVGLLWDRIDKTNAFYNNLLIVVRKT